jgi:hypothetical protein
MLVVDSRIEQFRQGIFSLRTNFGEFAQLMLQKDMGFFKADDNSYDLKDAFGNRIEVKFSRAYKKGIPIMEDNVISLCTNSSTMVYSFSEAEKKSSNYDCNIQQLKPSCFDYLYYGVFFADRIIIFKMQSSEVLSFPGFSDKQHRGNIGEGQFHIKSSNYNQHKKYFVKAMTYEQLYNLFEG